MQGADRAAKPAGKPWQQARSAGPGCLPAQPLNQPYPLHCRTQRERDTALTALSAVAQAWRAAAWELVCEAAQLKRLELQSTLYIAPGETLTPAGLAPPFLVAAAQALDMCIVCERSGPRSHSISNFDAPQTQRAIQTVLQTATALRELKAAVPLDLLVDLDGCVYRRY